MFVIVVYDINVDRVAKVCAYLRKYLYRVQNSVFEGEITKGQFARMKSGLKSIVVDDEDTVRIYILPHDNVVAIESIGKDISEFCQII
ncbi:CRISPR-associated endonuclease Cas2 [Methanospirillum purgamenti]|uniref:CRISPR-associated endoribonuclease Cas2 n=1 Tax=Methanospirillum hungatei TaxID=2203 RepID=A0A8F5ZHA9_METHU|nr:CRISPR-associated endonuclease Cas2 [Methanospirillum hungatei]QXO95654.1 CRISPR-associated endonuclease Cas2 [Methanospirillum hungatei]